MPNQHETTITNHLVNILRNMRHGWEVETAVHAFIKGNSELDAIVIERGREPIGIEAKFATTTNARNLIKQAETRLVHELEAEYYTASETLNNVMAILYPDRFKTMPGRDITPQLHEADDLQYKLVNTLGDTVGYFPENGWATGTVGDIANALHIGAIPTSQLEQAAEDMELSINRAASLLENAITDHRAIGTKIESILHQEVFSKNGNDEEEKLNTQTLRMAALIITDAFVFQSSLAGKAEMTSVRSLRQLLPTIDYADVIEDWNTILKVNYRPIFEDARELVKALATDDRLVKHILKLLCKAAKDLIDTGIAQIHELAGIVFQKLITDRKYVKANYTLPESAALLSTLVMPELSKGKLPKVADFACGTGALLNGVYQRILSLYEQQGGNGRDIHQKMLEENIAGTDVMPNATHLTAAALASRYADMKLGGTRILTAPYGKLDNGDYAVGSLELLHSILLLPTMGKEAEQVGGEENMIVDLQRAFPYRQFDIVIQNPPFTKPGADPAGIDGAKSPFQGSDRPKEYTKAMQEALKKKETQVADGQAGLSAYFVELADRMLKPNGTMGFILPSTVLASALLQSAHRLREGILELPMQELQGTVVKIPMCRVGDIASLGLAEVRGIFHKEDGYQPDGYGYPCLWNANSEVQRSMIVLPDSRAIPLPNAEAAVQRRVDQNSRTHYNMALRFNSNSVAVLFTEKPSIGPTLITNVAFENPKYEIPWTLWCNSTLGLLCHWLHSGKQNAGRGKLRLTALSNLPTLDVHKLCEKALTNAESLFERLKYKRMLPFNECAHDPVRRELDTDLLTEVLGIQNLGVLTAMQTLREMLCAEPSIHGGKKEPCELDAELAKMKLKDLPFPSWYLDE